MRGRRLRGRGAEAGGILGVNTPHFLEDPKNGSYRGWAIKNSGEGNFLGGGKNFRRGKKFFSGLCKKRSSKKFREIE